MAIILSLTIDRLCWYA